MGARHDDETVTIDELGRQEALTGFRRGGSGGFLLDPT
jgi:hypothetical protein